MALTEDLAATARDLSRRSGPPIRPHDVAAAMAFLAAHHTALDGMFRSILSSTQYCDPRTLRSEWVCLEDEVDAHLSLEDWVILPAFARQHPGEAHRLGREHDELRTAMTEMGIALDLDCLDRLSMPALISRIRDHGAREEQVLYRWAADSLPPSAWSHIQATLLGPPSVLGAPGRRPSPSPSGQ